MLQMLTLLFSIIVRKLLFVSEKGMVALLMLFRNETLEIFMLNVLISQEMI